MRVGSYHRSIGFSRRTAPILLLVIILSFACRSDSPQRAADRPRAQSDSVHLIIDYAPDRADTLSMTIPVADTMTVLDVLTGLTNREKIDLETRKFAMGTMIMRIGDRRNGEGGYWVYTVNSEAIPAAASAHMVSRGDTIRFIFKE